MPTATESRSVDPTRTSVLRKRYRQHYRRMWQRVNAAINEYIDGVDFSRPLAQRTAEFNRFVDALLQQEFGRAESDRERGVRAMAMAAYMRGVAQANTEVEEVMPTPQQAVMQADHNDAIGALVLLFSTRTMGIRTSLMGQLLAKYQQANGRDDAKALLRDRVLKIGRTRTDAATATAVIQGFNDAILNQFEAAGVEFVGSVPEKSYWQTQEDDGVCPLCFRMSQENDNGFGPGIYTISQARGLIPAHDRCRCFWRRLPSGLDKSAGAVAVAKPGWAYLGRGGRTPWKRPAELRSSPWGAKPSGKRR